MKTIKNMKAFGNISFWKAIVNESLLGQRGLIKRSTLWLPLALFMYSDAIDDLKAAFILSLYLMLAVQCWGMACTLVNDISDIKEDSAAGKKRWITNLSENNGRLIVIIVFVIGLLSIIFSKSSSGTLISYIAASAVGALYSIKPLRFKERGILGLYVYSLSVALIYVLVPWMMFKSGTILLSLLFF